MRYSGTYSCWYKYSDPQSSTLKLFSLFSALEDEKSEVIGKAGTSHEMHLY